MVMLRTVTMKDDDGWRASYEEEEALPTDLTSSVTKAHAMIPLLPMHASILTAGGVGGYLFSCHGESWLAFP